MTRWLAQFSLVALLSALAGWGFTVAFVFADLAPVVVTAAATAAVVALVLAVVRAGLAVSIVAQVMALVLALLVLVRDEPGGRLTVLVDVLANGPARLLTVAVPAPDDPLLLVVPFVGVWLACAVGCELARRSSGSLVPVVAPVTLLVCSQFFVLPTTPRATGPLWAVVAVAAALAAVRHRADEHEATVTDAQLSTSVEVQRHGGSGAVGQARRRRSLVVVASVVLLAMVGAGAAAVPAVRDRTPATLREHFVQPPRNPVVDNPLGAIPGNRLDDPTVDEDRREQEVVTVVFDDEVPLVATYGDAGDADDVLRVGWIVLDSFDGARWRTTATFEPVARELPPAPVDGAEPRQEVTGEIIVHELDAPWLPMVGRARQLSFLSGGRSLLVDQVTGTVAVPEVSIGTDAEQDPVRYRFVTEVGPAARLDSLGLVPGAPGDGVDWFAVVEEGEEFPSLVRRLEILRDEVFTEPFEGQLGFVDQLIQIEALFHNELASRLVAAGVDTDDLPPIAEQPFAFLLPPDELLPVADDEAVTEDAEVARVAVGHSFERILQFLGSPMPGREDEGPPDDAGQGTPEQFAAASALLLRSTGIPARVVVGWTVPGEEIDGSDVVVRRRHADAWVEVWTDSHGWVALDTTAEPTAELVDIDLEELPPPETTLVPEDIDRTPATVLSERAGGEGAGDQAGAWWAPLVALVVVAVLVGVVVPLALLAVRRRIRRRRRPASEAVAAAWDDAIEELIGSGMSVAVTMTTEEVVAAARNHLGDAPLQQLAILGGIVDESAHGAVEPTDAMAEQAWRSADRVRRVIRRRASFTSRLRRSVDVRPAVTRRRQLARADRLAASATTSAVHALR